MSRFILKVSACWAFALPLLLSPVLVTAGPFTDETREGIQQYNEGDYAKARRSFEAAHQADPEDPRAAYNLASTDYRLGNYDHAAEAFSQAEARFQDPGMKQKALYNKGNALYRSGNTDGAIDAYKKALELDPNDRDAKFNLEYVRMLQDKARQANRLNPQDMSQKQKPRPGGLNPTPQNQAGGKDKSDSKEPSVEPPDTPPDSQQAQKDTPQKNDATPEKKTSPQNAPPDTNTEASANAEQQQTDQTLQNISAMSREEADRWLHSLNEDLKKFSRRQLQGQVQDLFVEGDKDW